MLQAQTMPLLGGERQVPSFEVQVVETVAKEDEVVNILLELVTELLGDDGKHLRSNEAAVLEQELDQEGLASPAMKRDFTFK